MAVCGLTLQNVHCIIILWEFSKCIEIGYIIQTTKRLMFYGPSETFLGSFLPMNCLDHGVLCGVSIWGPPREAPFKAILYSDMATDGLCPFIMRTCSKIMQCPVKEMVQARDISKFHPVGIL